MQTFNAHPLPIHKAKAIAEEWRERLQKLPEINEIAIAGSLRRWCDQTEIIDLAASTYNNQSVLDFFASQAEVKSILSQYENCIRFQLHDGTVIQLWLQTPQRFGSLLLQATGSAAHTSALQAYAKQQGLSLTEEGISDENGNTIACPNEEKVYQTLRLPYIEPELREGRGEIEAASRGELPDLITLDDLHADLHMHTDWSDGHNSILEMAETAINLGHQMIAIADHTPWVCEPIHGRSINADNFQMQKQAILAVEKQCGDRIRILHGIEVDIRPDGSLDFSDELLRQFDLVIASLHSALDQPSASITQRLISAMRNPYVKIIAHPSGRDFPREGAKADWNAVFRAAAQFGKVLEINSNPLHLDLNDTLARQAAGMGIKLAINTDSHSAGSLVNLKYGVGIARRAWLSKETVINSLEKDDLLRFLGR